LSRPPRRVEPPSALVPTSVKGGSTQHEGRVNPA
jgi:hypothetical protein